MRGIRACLSIAGAVGISVVAAACGATQKPQALPTPPPAPAVVPSPAPVVERPVVIDPVTVLIETSQRHFESGERQLKAGHLERARADFDLAVQALLDSPYGARSEARLREHFDSLIDRINAYEVSALAQGDGFTEKKYEAATIDELLINATTFPAPPADPATKQAVAADLKNNEHDIPIPQQPKVLSYVELFQNRLRDYIQDSLQRGARYLPMIQSVFRAEGLPLDLAYIPIIESSFKTNALSKKKAKGPWQFMTATATENGLKKDWFIDERSDPEKATVAAVKYLKALNRMFGGDWNLVLAAYNGGPGRVQRAMKKSGLDDFWDMCDRPKLLPRETREYVPMILAAMIIARNPVQYGFDIVASEPISYDKVAMPRAVDLRHVAEWTGTTVDEIQALNPELRRWTTPVKYPKYEVKVPTGTADKLSARLAEASPADFTALKWYTTRKTDSLLSISRRFGVSRAELAEANGLSVKKPRIHAGQELMIPRAPAALLAARTNRSAPAQVSARAMTSSAEPPSVARAQTHAAPATQIYRVKRGDTLFSIARLFDTTVARLKASNRLHGSTIAPGARLKILAPHSH